MSEILDVEFDVKETDKKAWQAIFKVLKKTIGGAKLQDAMSVFGAAVDEKLEDILENDDFGCEVFNLDSWSLEGNHIHAEFDCANYLVVEEFQALFSLCPVENLSVSMD